jgi:predicted kinase
MPPSVLVLVGLPGSGKSTFTAALEGRAPSDYVRVCQDVLKTKPKCEKAAKAAIASGQVAVIDRTNVDAKQRQPWVELANSLGVPVAAVYFDVPPPLCMERVKSRTDHETNPPAFVVNMMKGRLRAPTAAEGFSRVDAVTTPSDVTQLVARLCGCGGEATAGGADGNPVDLTGTDPDGGSVTAPARAAAVDRTAESDTTAEEAHASRPRKRSKNEASGNSPAAAAAAAATARARGGGSPAVAR